MASHQRHDAARRRHRLALDHTLSPAMHNAAYEELGLDWVVRAAARRATRSACAASSRPSASLPFVGFNVTMPYKQVVLELCDEVATAAQHGRRREHGALRRRPAHRLQHRRPRDCSSRSPTRPASRPRASASCSSGPAVPRARRSSRSCSAAPRSVDVVSRDLDARRGARRARRAAPASATAAAAVHASTTPRRPSRDADLVVNATPVGMSAGRPEPDSRRVARARAGRARHGVRRRGPDRAAHGRARPPAPRALDGLGMLVAQGAIAIDIWNQEREGTTPRATSCAAAAEAELARRASRRW